MDNRLRMLLSAPAAGVPPSPLLEATDDWFRRSRRCAFQVDHRGCALAAYQEALAVWTPPGTARTPASRCRLSGMDVVLASIDDGVVLMRDGSVIGVATPEKPSWQPFLRYERTRSRVRLRDLNGKVLATCTLARGSGQ